jgi:hypothetical protein
MQMHTTDVKSSTNEAPSILTTPVVETGTSAVSDETVVDAFPENDTDGFQSYLDMLQSVAEKFQDLTAGSREEDQSYKNRETLAERLERKKKELTGNGKAERKERKREKTAFADEKQGLEDITQSLQTRIGALHDEDEDILNKYEETRIDALRQESMFMLETCVGLTEPGPNLEEKLLSIEDERDALDKT